MARPRMNYRIPSTNSPAKDSSFTIASYLILAPAPEASGAVDRPIYWTSTTSGNVGLRGEAGTTGAKERQGKGWHLRKGRVCLEGFDSLVRQACPALDIYPSPRLPAGLR